LEEFLEIRLAYPPRFTENPEDLVQLVSQNISCCHNGRAIPDPVIFAQYIKRTTSTKSIFTFI
jgi:hypothetical protein